VLETIYDRFVRNVYTTYRQAQVNYKNIWRIEMGSRLTMSAASRLDETRGSVNIVGGSGSSHDEALRLRFERFMSEHPHLTTSVLDKEHSIGVSKTALDLLLKGEYFLRGGPGGAAVNPKASRIESKVREYLDRMENTNADGSGIGFVRTVLASQLEYACSTAIEENIIVVAYGSPGHGKSVSLQQYVLDRMTTPPIRILCSRNITPGYFVRRLASELRLKNLGCIPETEDRIAESLIKNKRVIFVDQANYLDERGLGTICHIWERARVGIVLAGTHQLYELFSMLTDREDIKAQLSSRVAMFVPLKGLSLEEVKPVVQKTLGRRATAAVVAAVFNAISSNQRSTTGTYQVANFRNLSFLLPRLKALFDKNAEAIAAGDLKAEDLVASAMTRLMLG